MSKSMNMGLKFARKSRNMIIESLKFIIERNDNHSKKDDDKKYNNDGHGLRVAIKV